MEAEGFQVADYQEEASAVLAEEVLAEVVLAVAAAVAEERAVRFYIKF